MKMISSSMYLVLFCLLVVTYDALGFSIERELYGDENDSGDDEEGAVMAERQVNSNIKYLNFGYSKDSFNVYYMGKKIDGASVFTFQALNYGYAKDAFNVYYMGTKIGGASVFTFQVLNYGYAKDAFNPYYIGRKIDGASVFTFQVLANGYAKDAFRVYFLGQRMQGVSPHSFSG